MNVCLKGANVRAKRGFKKVRLRGEVGVGAERSSSPDRRSDGNYEEPMHRAG